MAKHIVRKRKEDGTRRSDMVQMLLDAQSEIKVSIRASKDQVVTDNELAGNVILIMVAGHETTSVVTSFLYPQSNQSSRCPG